MSSKEATARIKINHLLEEAGWRFFADGSTPANIRLEPSVTIKSAELDAMGENFEKTSKGFIDFLLLDAEVFHCLCWKPSQRIRTRLSAKSRPENAPSRRTVVLSSFPTETFTISGIWNGATRISSLHFQRPLPSPATSRSSPTRSDLLK
jgi:hypothetical protein